MYFPSILFSEKFDRCGVKKRFPPRRSNFPENKMEWKLRYHYVLQSITTDRTTNLRTYDNKKIVSDESQS